MTGNTNDTPTNAHRLLESFTPETEPDRRGWQVFLAVAWSMRPRAGVDELVDLAITLGGPVMAPADRDVVEQTALAMLLARGEATSCR